MPFWEDYTAGYTEEITSTAMEERLHRQNHRIMLLRALGSLTGGARAAVALQFTGRYTFLGVMLRQISDKTTYRPGLCGRIGTSRSH